MKTSIIPEFAATHQGKQAEAILRACVHCGFCTATCPTYQELNDERDGPRGRIYLVKQFLEGGEITERTRIHLDRCLTCRSCETTCPSGVQYGRLIDIARSMMEEHMPRSSGQRLMRRVLRTILPRTRLFGFLLALGRAVRPLTPAIIRDKIPPRQKSSPWPKSSHQRVMLLLDGCAQPSATPRTNAAAARILDRLGVTLLVPPEAGCCGAVSYHLGAHGEGLDFMRRNIDAWWPAIEAGAEAIVISASGCGSMVKEYGALLENDPAYAEKARRVSNLCADLSQIIAKEDLCKLDLKPGGEKIALHIPCTLQHGLSLPDTVRDILLASGFELCRTSEDHLCCGSAGTYSILQPKMSKRLLARKINALQGDEPEVIATANIGCQLHLQTGTGIKVRHWIELLDRAAAPEKAS